MSRLTVRAERRPDHDLYHLDGNIVAGAGQTLRDVTKGAGKLVVFDWHGITITSSDGIREWVYFLDEFAKGREVHFAECPPSIVLSFNMFPRCIGPAKVVSAYGTFVCQLCNKEKWELLVVGKDVSPEGRVGRQVSCEACGSEMHLNLPEDEYFGFLTD